MADEIKKSVFEILNAINVNGHTEAKNGLTYLSWAWAWAEVKKAFPNAFYTIYENAQGLNYHTDGRTCWVKTGVTIEGLEHIEYLPVMDFKNKSIPLNAVTSFDVNKAIQRSLTKAVARHGLGLYIYAGEDLPEAEAESPENSPKTAKKGTTRNTKAENAPALICADCGATITATKLPSGDVWNAERVANYARARYNRNLCPACMNKAEEAKKKAAENKEG